MAWFNPFKVKTTVQDVEKDLYASFIKTYNGGLGAGDPLANADVFASMRILTTAFKSQKYEFDKAYLNHLVKRPNGYQNFDTFMDEVLFNLLLFGNSYVYNDKANKELRVLEYSKVNVAVRESNSQRVVKYTYKSDNGNTLILNNEDVLHFKIYSDGGILGRSPLTALQNELVSTRRGLAAIKDFFSRSTFSNGLLRIKEGKVSDETKQALKEGLAAELNNSDGTGLFILDATMDFEVLPVDTSVFKLLEFHKYSSEQVRKVFGIPKSMFGEELVNSKDDIVYDQFVRTAVSPLLEAINAELLTKMNTTLVSPTGEQGTKIEEVEDV